MAADMKDGDVTTDFFFPLDTASTDAMVVFATNTRNHVPGQILLTFTTADNTDHNLIVIVEMSKFKNKMDTFCGHTGDQFTVIST